MYHPPRGGVRGGKDQFEWESVRKDKHKENYLGNSISITPAPTFNCRKPNTLWYQRDTPLNVVASKRTTKEELDEIKQQEQDLMNEALGIAPTKKRKAKELGKLEMQELLRRGETEHNEADRTGGVGYAPAPKPEAVEIVGGPSSNQAFEKVEGEDELAGSTSIHAASEGVAVPAPSDRDRPLTKEERKEQKKLAKKQAKEEKRRRKEERKREKKAARREAESDESLSSSANDEDRRGKRQRKDETEFDRRQGNGQRKEETAQRVPPRQKSLYSSSSDEEEDKKTGERLAEGRREVRHGGDKSDQYRGEGRVVEERRMGEEGERRSRRREREDYPGGERRSEKDDYYRGERRNGTEERQSGTDDRVIGERRNGNDGDYARGERRSWKDDRMMEERRNGSERDYARGERRSEKEGGDSYHQRRERGDGGKSGR